jgi:hypothetical protein
MQKSSFELRLLSALCLLGPLGCFGVAEDGDSESELGTTWEALMADGDVATIAPDAAQPAPAAPLESACSDCEDGPLAFWRLDDCNSWSTQLSDSAYSAISHPAFRAVSAACVPGASGQAVQLSNKEDVVYAPDQPDFNFDNGLTVAAFITPDRVKGTQSIVRKRFDGTSSFLLAIDDKKLSFVLRLDSGRLAGVSAPIEAGRTTHVAASYDGSELRLYLDGVLEARTRARGQIARGAGPIFIGNDADGRQFKGVVDEVWLDTSAASPSTIQELTCIRRAPELSVSPAESAPQVAGSVVAYDVSITNRNDASCGDTDFVYFPSLPFHLSSDSFGFLNLASGETAHATLDVRSSSATPVGAYPFDVYAHDPNATSTPAIASATYVVGTGPVSCDGLPPFVPELTGSFASPVGGLAVYSAPGLNPPSVSAINSAEGAIDAVQVSAVPGVPLNPLDNWFGVNLYFTHPSCVDASAYTGVRFSVEGDLGSCGLALEAVTAQDNSIQFGGACTEAICYGPLSGPVGLGTSVIRFADMTGGVPMSNVDPTALQGIQFALNAPGDPAAEPCQANITIRDVAFVNESPLAYDFDTGASGWMLSDWDDPNNTAVHVPAGGTAPTLSFSASEGDPSPGSLLLAGHFTAAGQYVDAQVNRDSLDVSGTTLRARVKWVSGALPVADIQLHASSLPDYSWYGSSFDAALLATGEWMSLELDLASAPLGFDACQIAQIGVQVVASEPSGPFVLAIDTVTN